MSGEISHHNCLKTFQRKTQTDDVQNKHAARQHPPLHTTSGMN